MIILENEEKRLIFYFLSAFWETNEYESNFIEGALFIYTYM